MESLDAADLVLIEPPSSVWDGIEASIESGRGGLPGSPSPESTVAIVEYSIDASDVLAEVGAGWVDAAIDHGAPELARPDDNRVLWESIDGDEIARAVAARGAAGALGTVRGTRAVPV